MCHDINKGWKENCELCWRSKTTALLSSFGQGEDGFVFGMGGSGDDSASVRSTGADSTDDRGIPVPMSAEAAHFDGFDPSRLGQQVSLEQLTMPMNQVGMGSFNLIPQAQLMLMQQQQMGMQQKKGRKKRKKSTTVKPKKKRPPRRVPKPKKIIREFACPHCDKVYTDSRQYRAHSAQHKWGPHATEVDPATGKSRFRCLHPGCTKVVNDRKVLRKHLLTHREKQFMCHYAGCDKRFYERAKLKRHFLVHTGEKPFSCPYKDCGKPFGYKANLKTHMRTHTGQRPFACTVPGCLRRFAQASNRNSHVLTHQKQSSNNNTGKKSKNTNVDSKTKSTTKIAATATVVEVPVVKPKNIKVTSPVKI